MTTLFENRTEQKVFGVCQILLLGLAALLQYGSTIGINRLVELGVPKIYQKWHFMVFIVCFFSVLILAFGITRWWKTNAVHFLAIIAQAVGLLVCSRALYVLFSGIDGWIPIFTIYEYYTSLAFSIVLLALLYAKYKLAQKEAT